MEHEEHADELERETDRMEHDSDKVGDQIDITYTRALLLSIERVK